MTDTTKHLLIKFSFDCQYCLGNLNKPPLPLPGLLDKFEEGILYGHQAVQNTTTQGTRNRMRTRTMNPCLSTEGDIRPCFTHEGNAYLKSPIVSENNFHLLRSPEGESDYRFNGEGVYCTSLTREFVNHEMFNITHGSKFSDRREPITHDFVVLTHCGHLFHTICLRKLPTRSYRAIRCPGCNDWVYLEGSDLMMQFSGEFMEPNQLTAGSQEDLPHQTCSCTKSKCKRNWDTTQSMMEQSAALDSSINTITSELEALDNQLKTTTEQLQAKEKNVIVIQRFMDRFRWPHRYNLTLPWFP